MARKDYTFRPGINDDERKKYDDERKNYMQIDRMKVMQMIVLEREIQKTPES